MDKQETAFRIGGCYFNRGGEVVKLKTIWTEGHADVWERRFPGHTFTTAARISGYARGYVSLVHGQYVDSMVKKGSDCRDLIPGELHCVNGEWVPISAETAVAAEALQELRERYRKHFARTDPAAAVEPLRSPLDWAKRTLFDNFGRDFIVTSGSSDPHAFAGSFGSPDLERSAHQVAPMFGSAFLCRD